MRNNHNNKEIKENNEIKTNENIKKNNINIIFYLEGMLLL